MNRDRPSAPRRKNTQHGQPATPRYISRMHPPIVHHPAYTAADIPADHRFPMGKFTRLAEVLVEDRVVPANSFVVPEPAPAHWLELAHTPDYVDAILNCTLDAKLARRIGFPMIPSVAARSSAAVGGTIAAARAALATGMACNTAGGSHHADRDGGAGFCVFNDVAVAALVLLDEAAINNALVIDLDVHQGDGTAKIFANNPLVRTVSMHCEKNWPHRKAQSDRDIGLDAGLEDADYLAMLDRVLDEELAEPWDMVFYNAGVDPHRDDRLGLLSLSDTGLAERDRRVLSRCWARNIPVVGVLGGGYDQDVTIVARRHALLHKAATQVFATQSG